MSDHIKGEVIIFVLDSAEISPEVYLSSVLKLSKKNRVLLVMGNKLISVGNVIKSETVGKYLKVAAVGRNNFKTFLPIGLLPFQRFSVIYKLNLFLTLKLLGRKLESSGRTYIERPIVYYLCSKRDNGLDSLYIPGMFKEKLCVDDMGMLTDKLFNAKMMTRYEKDVLEHADVVVINKNSSAKCLLSYKWKFLRTEENFSQKISLVMKMIKSWGK